MIELKFQVPGGPAWGLASWELITEQARLVALAPALALVGLSMSSSAIHLGNATGAAVDALVIIDGAMARLGRVVAGFGLTALCRWRSAAAACRAGSAW